MTTAHRPLAALLAALALGAPAVGAAQASQPREAVEPLMDNIFLVEEAYNQEAGVVQQILTFQRDTAGSGAWLATLTQEWPAPGQAHQLSYTLAYLSPGAGSTQAFSDLLLNYRYQAAYQEGKLGFAPRLSLVVPTGGGDGTGYRGFGPQLGLPVSVRLTPWLEAHSNLGVTWVPGGRAAGQRAEYVTLSVGQSFVVGVTPRLNLLLEAVYASTDVTVGGATLRGQALTLSPGVRWGIDLPHDTQVVLGLAVPLGVGPSAGEAAVFGYLSVELPFWRPAEG
jgi:hypothetical protein